MYSAADHARCRWHFFFSRIVKKIFIWNCGPWWFIYCQLHVFENKRSVSRNAKWIHMAPEDILRSYKAKQSVCERNWILFTACFFLFSKTCSRWLAFYESPRTTVQKPKNYIYKFLYDIISFNGSVCWSHHMMLILWTKIKKYMVTLYIKMSFVNIS